MAIKRFIASLVIMSMVFLLETCGSAQTLDWIRQETDDRDRRAYGVTVDSLGNPVMVGLTNSFALPDGDPIDVISSSQSDIFASKYTATGEHVWTALWGDNCVEGGIVCREAAFDVVADESENIYIGGVGPGSPADALILSFDSAGRLRWKSQLNSTSESRYRSLALDLSQDAVYAVGNGSRNGGSSILSKWSTNGAEQWTVGFGEFISGRNTNLGGTTYVEHSGMVGEAGEILRYDHEGQQIGSIPAPEAIQDLAASDSVGLVALGTTDRDVSVPLGPYAADLRRLDSDGTVVWQRQLSVNADTRPRAVALDEDGTVYITGHSFDDPGDRIQDAFVSAISPDGDVLWTREFGFPESDTARDIAVDERGHIYVAGTNRCSQTECDLDDTPGLYAFLARFSVDDSFQRGDFNFDGVLSAADLDLMASEIRKGSVNSFYDLDKDLLVEANDIAIWVTEFKGTFAGDANLDGNVDFSDFLLLSKNFGGDGGWSEGDFDASGDVDFDDFLDLSANFGNTAQGLSSVPEPSSAFLALACVAVLAACIRKSRRRKYQRA